MDSASRIETYKAGLRLLYANDVAGLKKIVHDLMEGAASDTVLITSHNFVDGGASGQAHLEPLARLNAAISVLAELDPDSAVLLAGPGRTRFADFSRMNTET